MTWQDDKDEFVIYVWLCPNLFCKVAKPKERAYQAGLRSSIIVHECVHVKQFVEKAIGSTLDDETEAYMMQKLVEDLAGELFKIWKQ